MVAIVILTFIALIVIAIAVENTVISAAALAVLGIILLYILLLVVTSLTVDTKKVYSRHNRFYRRVLQDVTAVILFIVGVRTKVSGRELLPEGRFLIVSNHRSNFDSIVTWHALRRYNISYIAKPSLFKIPVFGRLIRSSCFMPIDRENARNALTTFRHAAQLMSEDQANVGVFPEGTRNKSCEGLLPFHHAVFKAAQEANVPVVVCAVTETQKIHKNVPFGFSTVYLDILEVLPAQFVTSSKRMDISERVNSLLTAGLKRREG